MSKAKISLGKVTLGIIIFALFIALGCTENQPYIVREDKLGSIVGIVKPLGVVSYIKVIQGIPIDSTYSDSTSGYFRINNLQVGFYTLEVGAAGYGKYIENGVEIVANGITTIGNIYLKKIPEQIAAIFPYQNSENVPLTAPCSFDFVTPMNHNSVENNFNIAPAIDGHFQWEESDTKCSIYFYPDPRYKANTAYTFSLNTPAKTIYGDTLSFLVNSNFITEPVKIQSYTPEDGATYVGVSTTIYIRFNTDINRTSVENAFKIVTTTAGNFLWHNNESFSFKSNVFLATSTQYTITISTNAKDIYGSSLSQPFTLVFTTEPLNINYTYPSNGATNINRNANIQLAFNTNVDQTATENAFSITPLVSGIFEWIDLTKFTYYPDATLEANTLYIVTINTNCKDTYGKNLPKNYSINFKTKSE